MNSIFDTLNSILSNINAEELTADSVVYEELKDGYYLTEIESAELKSSNSGKPMASLKGKIVEDGYEVKFTDDNDVTFTQLKRSKGRIIFFNFVLNDETSVKRFITNMLKFEGEEEGVPLVPKEAFLNSDTLADALDILVGSRIYTQISSSIKADGTKSTWNNFVSWKRAKALELPE